MDRRTFLALCAAIGGGCGTTTPGRHAERFSASGNSADFFPQPPLAKKLAALSLPRKTSWDETVLLTSLQGLVNRTDPQIYFVQVENDQFWLDYYRDRYAIPYATVQSTDELLDQFAREAEGYVVYDPAMLDSANVATTFGGMHNLIPVSPDLAPKLRAHGLKGRQNWTGRWKTRYEAYDWAIRNLRAYCHPHLLGTMCVDVPLWPSNDLPLRDYLVAHKIFTFDLSANMRDREDRDQLTEVLKSVSRPGCLLGWRCVRCQEHELVALAAQHDVYMQCCLATRNLSIHSAIPRATEPFKQVHRLVAGIGEVEKKVYIACMATDGDSTSSMLQLQAERFNDPEHGQIPYAWGFLPIAVDLMPGVVMCNYERKTDNDYFVAPSSGVLYTYPDLLPNARPYYAMTREYMRKLDLDAAYMINWVDEFWWQEMDLPDFTKALRKELPESIAFFRGQGESAFERQYVDDGAPYIMSGEGIHRTSDVYGDFKQFIEANPNRPLFIFCLSNHSMPLGKTKDAFDRLKDHGVELVRLDEFVHLVNKAYAQGLVSGDEFYPDKSRLRAILADEAIKQWPDLRKGISGHAELAKLSEPEYRSYKHDEFTRVLLDRSSTPPSDIVAYNAFQDSMLLVKSALNRRGIYVNNKAKGVQDFMHEYRAINDIRVIQEIWDLWRNWEKRRPSFEEACQFAGRIEALSLPVSA